MKVVITKCSKDAYWYSGSIGVEFNVKENPSGGYDLIESEFLKIRHIFPDNILGLYIFEEDCEVSEEARPEPNLVTAIQELEAKIDNVEAFFAAERTSNCDPCDCDECRSLRLVKLSPESAKELVYILKSIQP